MHFHIACVYFAAVLSTASAQTVRFSAPTAGFIFDPQASAIRPIVGVLGAAYLGPPTISGLQWASLAPDGKTAMVVRETDLYFVRDIASEQPAWNRLDSLHPLLACWSGSSSAAIYTAGALRLIEGGSGAPLITTVDLGLLEGSVTRIACDPAGRNVYLAVEAQTGGGVYVASAAFPPRLVASVDRPTALASLPSGLIVGAASGEQLLLIRDPAGHPDTTVVAIDGDSSQDWVAAAPARDSRTVFIADRASSSIRIFDLASEQWVARIALDLPPTRLEPLPGGHLYQLNSPGAGTPLLVLKTDGAPSVYFVPSGSAAGSEE